MVENEAEILARQNEELSAMFEKALAKEEELVISSTVRRDEHGFFPIKKLSFLQI